MVAESRKTGGDALVSISEWTGIAQAAISLLMVVVVWSGIGAMRRTGDERSARDDQRHAEFMAAHEASHAEFMAAHKASHAEFMAAHKESMAAHEEYMAALGASHAENMRALDALIERTGG